MFFTGSAPLFYWLWPAPQRCCSHVVKVFVFFALQCLGNQHLSKVVCCNVGMWQASASTQGKVTRGPIFKICYVLQVTKWVAASTHKAGSWPVNHSKIRDLLLPSGRQCWFIFVMLQYVTHLENRCPGSLFWRGQFRFKGPLLPLRVEGGWRHVLDAKGNVCGVLNFRSCHDAFDKNLYWNSPSGKLTYGQGVPSPG